GLGLAEPRNLQEKVRRRSEEIVLCSWPASFLFERNSRCVWPLLLLIYLWAASFINQWETTGLKPVPRYCVGPVTKSLVERCGFGYRRKVLTFLREQVP